MIDRIDLSRLYRVGTKSRFNMKDFAEVLLAYMRAFPLASEDDARLRTFIMKYRINK